jgi:hypothetical protein
MKDANLPKHVIDRLERRWASQVPGSRWLAQRTGGTFQPPRQRRPQRSIESGQSQAQGVNRSSAGSMHRVTHRYRVPS